MTMELNISHQQKLAMTQQMILAVKILQMNSLDLEDYLLQEALENPLMELEIPKQAEEPGFSVPNKTQEQDSDDNDFFKYWTQPKREQQMPLYQKESGETLQESLLFQLLGFYIPEQVEQIVRYLIGNLDENGYLAFPRQQLLKELNCSAQLLNEALNVLHQMNPAGVGAFDLRECLLIQAKQLNPPNPVLLALIESHLSGLSKNRLDKLAEEMGVSIDALKTAKDALLTLNPKPGNGFSLPAAVPYVCPDLFVVRTQSGFQVRYNDFSHPKIEINNNYQDLMKSADAETAAYIQSKMASTKHLISSVNQRKNTILNCAKIILSRQLDFFENGPGHLAPLTLSDVAEILGVHKSTVSRAVNGKYLQSQWGVQCLSEFFSRGVSKSSGEKSYDMVLVQIKKIIDQEDPHHPMSDQKIVHQLEILDIKISRRTVAKYRDQAQIPPASGRKEF